MALKLPPSPLIISLVQGGADAFVQGSVVTGLGARQAYALKGVGIQLLSNIPATEAANIQVAITRRSKTAMPNVSDPDVLHYFEIHARSLSAVGFAANMSRYIYQLAPFNIPLVEDPIYACLDSAATTIVNSVIVRLDVELDSISDIDRLNLIARSLS